MSVKALQRHQGDRALNAVQDNMEEHTRILTECPIIDGKLITDIEVEDNGVVKEFEHGLGRKPKGWIVVRRVYLEYDALAMPLYESKSYENKDKVLRVYTPADGIIVDLWVF